LVIMIKYTTKYHKFLSLLIALLAAVGAYTHLFSPSQATQFNNSHSVTVGESGNAAGRDQSVYQGVPNDIHDRTTRELGREEEKNRTLEQENRLLKEKIKKLEQDLQHTGDDSDEVKLLKGRALKALQSGDYVGTEKLIIEAAAKSKVDRASLIANVGDIQFIQSNLLGAAHSYARAADMVVGSERAVYLKNQGEALYKVGKCDQAEPILREALQIRESNFGKSSSEIVDSLKNLADCEKSRGREDRAKEYLLRAEKIEQERNHLPSNEDDLEPQQK
jgi:tetratricopeptide (TPR) repeat protein